MCNIAGYIGNRPAAPILVEMMKNQEGYCGGYYTGIVTLHEGKLWCAKVIGDVDRLLAETDAMNFPGTCGLIHSRSKSGGDRSWAHPFTSGDGKLALVLNGGKVQYAPVCDDAGAARELWAQGVRFATECPRSEEIRSFPVLENGNSVHDTELICLLTHWYRQQEGISTEQALEKAFLRVPMEAVSLVLNAEEGRKISFANYNMPMTVARTEEEVFLASFSICFPENRSYLSREMIPCACSGTVTEAETRIHRFRPIKPVGPVTPDIVHAAWEIQLKLLAEGSCTIGKLNDTVRGLWTDAVDQRYPLTYGILQRLWDQDRLRIVKTKVPGVEPNLTAPRFELALKKK